MLLNQGLTNSILSVNYFENKGLQLAWNFKGSLNSDQQFRHILIIEDSSSSLYQNFAQLYYKKIKIGDLFAIVNPKSKKVKPIWIEKSQANHFDQIKWDKEYDQQRQLTQALKQIGQLTAIYSQNLITNILPKGFIPNKKIIQLIQQWREFQYYRFIINIYHEKNKNSINISLGLNTINLLNNTIKESVQFIKWYTNSIIVLNAQLQIQSLNGQIYAQNAGFWRNIQFNKLKKRYYGLTKRRTTQNICIIDNFKKNKIYTLKIGIKYTLLNFDTYTSSKTISITNVTHPITRTLNDHHNQQQNYYQLFQDYYVNEDPFHNEAYIWFQKDTEIKYLNYFNYNQNQNFN